MTAQQDATLYLYENIGVQITPPSPDGTLYLYENIGVALAQGPEGTLYLYEYIVPKDIAGRGGAIVARRRVT